MFFKIAFQKEHHFYRNKIISILIHYLFPPERVAGDVLSPVRVHEGPAPRDGEDIHRRHRQSQEGQLRLLHGEPHDRLSGIHEMLFLFLENKIFAINY